jgi:N-acyl homoserine lactone hydrolase
VHVYAFHGGHEEADTSMFLLGTDIGVPRRIPFQFFLVEHERGRLLFDTGANPRAVEDPAGYPPSVRFGSVVTAADLAPARLAELGLSPSDVELVANSHLHYDHCGGNRLFAHATFLAQTAELRGAHWPEPFARENYERSDFDLPVAWRELDGAYDVFGDGMVTLLPTPGHTAGHQSLVLRWPQRTVVLAQDAVYLERNLRERIIPATLWDPHAIMRSYDALLELERLEDATILPGHDLDAWTAIPKAPERWLG